MTHSPFITEKQAAERLGVAATTLAGWRAAGKGPAFRKFEGAIRYSVAELEAYVEAAR